MLKKVVLKRQQDCIGADIVILHMCDADISPFKRISATSLFFYNLTIDGILLKVPCSV